MGHMAIGIKDSFLNVCIQHSDMSPQWPYWSECLPNVLPDLLCIGSPEKSMYLIYL